jgi:hypothetical protein
MRMANAEISVSERAKQLLSEHRQRIALNDFVNHHLRRTLEALSVKNFPLNEGGSKDDFVKRIEAYEAAIGDLQAIAILIARWGDADASLQLEKILSRIANADKGASGSVVWLQLRWYPVLVLMYAAGIAALSAKRYDALQVVLATSVRADQASSGNEALLTRTIEALLHVNDNFKALPGHEKDRYPRSEHLFQSLGPTLDEALFLGEDYERLFDRFEVLAALAFADFRDPSGEGDCWGPPGRFAYKNRYSGSPMATLLAEAEAEGQGWPLLSTRLFGGKSERFLKVAQGYQQLLSRHISW